MSTVASIANCLVTIRRPTAYLLDAEAVGASHTIDRQPPAAGPVEVSLTGTPTGTVTVSGTVAGASDTEVLTWSGVSGTRATVKSFTTVSGVTTSLSGASQISARSLSPGGAPQSTYQVVVSGRPAHRAIRGQQSFVMIALGQERKEGATFRIPYEEVWRPYQGDLVVVEGGGEQYEIAGTPRPFGDFAVDHWQIQADLVQGRVG